MMAGEEIPQTLTKAQMDEGLEEGRRRQDEDDKRGLKTRFEAFPGRPYWKNCIGALAERAFWEYRHPGEPWKKPSMGAHDVDGYEVRGREVAEGKSPELYGLIIRPWDKNERPMALVLMLNPASFMIVGYVERLGDWKTPEYFKEGSKKDDSPYWEVPRYPLKRLPKKPDA
jgi:hypothetical protein